MEEQASQQRAILSSALTRGQFLPGELNALEAAQADEASNLAVFNTSATVAQRQHYSDTVDGSLVTRAANQEQNAISLAGPVAAGASGSLRSDITSAGDWYGSMSDVIGRMRSVESSLVGDITSRSAALRSGAITSAAAGSGLVLLVLLISVVFTTLVVRSMVGPLRQLRSGALDVAGVRLPEMVRRMGESDGGQEPADVEPIAVDSADEIGEVARAFDQVHREALRLAANEALLRGNVNAMFVNLSRRTQSLVERQLEMIDELEQGEADPARLESLFRMDHLATRMRRNSENLLVLAGHESLRQWRRPVVLADVLRAAVSEIEQYARVHLDVQPGVSVHGQAVGDVVHLVSELVENATAFSPVETPVTVSAQIQSGGGLLVEISDQGIGMSADELAHANWRLDNPPVVDVAVSRRMGLFVVGRLAARNGIRVRLRPGPEGGLAALIWLPDELVVREALGSVAGSWPARTAGAAGPLQRARLDAGHTGPQPVLGAPVASQAPAQPSAGPARPDPAAPAHPPETPHAQQPPEDAPSDQPSPGAPSDRPPPWAPPAPPPEVRPAERAGGLPARRPLGAAPHVTSSPAHEKIAAVSSPAGSEHDPVVIPPGVNGGRNRLPIFESLESDWFRRGSGSPSVSGSHAGIDPVSGPGRTDAPDTGNWTSPGDEGWRAAEAARAPVSGGITEAGLPKRVPRANLVPGSVGGPGAGAFGDGGHQATVPEPAPAGTARSAQEIRERLASFQRGARAGHAAGRGGQLAAGEEEWEGNA
jgi:signal transduction histidine kinase